jgi:hypothetical protein
MSGDMLGPRRGAILTHHIKKGEQSMKFATGLAVLTVAIVSTLAIGQAHAVNEQLTFSSNPSARCQPATKASEALIRKRPLAMVNEGTSNATINCAFELEARQTLAQQVTVFLSNSTATAVNATCTGVSGWEGMTEEPGVPPVLTEYVPVQLSVPAGGQSEAFQWADADFENGTGGLISVSCVLPPGVAINDTYADVLIDDAAPAAP